MSEKLFSRFDFIPEVDDFLRISGFLASPATENCAAVITLRNHGVVKRRNKK
jgi:hypothetical protein